MQTNLDGSIQLLPLLLSVKACEIWFSLFAASHKLFVQWNPPEKGHIPVLERPRKSVTHAPIGCKLTSTTAPLNIS